MKHISQITQPNKAECNAIQAAIFGVLAPSRYFDICNAKGRGKEQ